MTISFYSMLEALYSLGRVLTKLPWVFWSIWRWKREHTPLCFGCWLLWRQGNSILTSQKTANCPSCKFFLVALRARNLPDIDSWFVTLQGQAGKSVSVQDNGRPVAAPLYIEMHLRTDWSTKFWISYEESSMYNHHMALQEQPRKATFDVPGQVDGSLLRTWIRSCESHGAACSLNVRSTERDLTPYTFILVDVRQMRLVHRPLWPKDHHQRYVALSYVWGTSDFFKTKKSNIDSLLQPGSLCRPDVTLPNTFKDAMKLVDLLGEKYIWIDALCIVQDDDMKHGQLRIMDKIYGRAYLTIVCLSGNNVHSVLPGIDSGTRTMRPFRGNFHQGNFITALPSLEQAIETSSHYTRAWTFQETFLSRRCLFISEGQFFFRCSKSCFAESLDWQAEISPGFASKLGLAPPSDFRWHEGIYEDSVEHYTSRKLSYDQDIVNAFRGGLERLQEMGYRLHGSGLTDTVSARSLLWFSLDKNARRRENTRHNEIAFPSWCWTGWKGAVTYASLNFGRNVSTYTTSLRSSHRIKEPGDTVFRFLGDKPRGFFDRRVFCKEPDCVRLLQPPRFTPFYHKELHTGLRRFHLYQFYASVCAASSFTFPSWQTYRHKNPPPYIDIDLLDIYGPDKKRCGALFNPPLPSLDSSELHEYLLVALSMKKQYDWLEGISSSDYDMKDTVENSVIGCGCWLNVMLLKKSKEFDGIVERVAVGQMHPKAWLLANPTDQAVTIM